MGRFKLIELPHCLSPKLSTPESKQPIAVDGLFTSKPYGAGKEARTLDLYLGKVSLYQLSYSRIDLVAWGWIEKSTATRASTHFQKRRSS